MKTRGKKKSKGFERGLSAVKIRPQAIGEDIAIPEGFKTRMRALLSAEYPEFEASMNATAEVSVRINPAKSIDLRRCFGEPLQGVAWCESGYYLSERPNFARMPEWHCGAFYVQEASSMVHGYILRSLDRNRDVRVMDMCAAPGGKTTSVLSVLEDNSMLVANEYDGKRAQVLYENLTKWGVGNAIITNCDTSTLAKSGLEFDVVICDAPCSGEGMMRKESQARVQWGEGLIEQCSALQREILRNAYKMLRPGGILIYSTCTYNLEENECQVAYMMQEYDMQPLKIEFPKDSGIAHDFMGGNKGYRFMPHRTRGEGLFVSVMEKPKTIQANEKPKRANIKEIENSQIREWLSKEDITLISKEDRYYAVPRGMLEIYEAILSSGCRVINVGAEVAYTKGNDIMPSHALAMNGSLLREGTFPAVDLSEEEALKYLRGESMVMPLEISKGAVLVRYSGNNLGFVKNIGGRGNNLYPRAWRLRNI